jgi:DNA-binding PadR family transcriptional regulator
MSSGLGELGRFSEPALYILVSLAGGPKHGYAMMLDIEELSGARPGPGTLYGALARLESRGWITALPAEERRKPYALTAAGLGVLEARLTELQALAGHGRQRLEAAR